MLTTIRPRATRLILTNTTRCTQPITSVRSYYTSNSSSSAYGYTAYSSVDSYPSSTYSAATSSSTFTPAADAAIGCPSTSSDISPISCMNRNARKPSKANHGARPNSSYNRKSSSPEFGSWRHPGLRPGQSPPPRPQPGTPITIATVGVGATVPTPIVVNKEGVKKQTA